MKGIGKGRAYMREEENKYACVFILTFRNTYFVLQTPLHKHGNSRTVDNKAMTKSSNNNSNNNNTKILA